MYFCKRKENYCLICGKIWLLATTLKNAKTAKSLRFFSLISIFHLKEMENELLIYIGIGV